MLKKNRVTENRAQMLRWVNENIRDHQANLVRGGFQVSMASAPIHVRWLGRPAASRRRQAMFTCQDLDTARAGFLGTWGWWTAVPYNVDSRGWRMVSCHWYCS